MIPVETWYKTYNSKLMAIIEAWKTWRYYLEGYKHQILVLTDHNNLHQFMDTKNLSFVRFDGLKSSFDIIFKSITTKERQIEL